jgi:ATP-dependent RNA helicase RhlE
VTGSPLTFESFRLDARVGAGVNAAGYTTPTPIQKQAIPAALAGRDILGLAQTGTGKTAAFVLPILHRLLDGPRGRVRALIVAPTRELAEQIHGEIVTLGQGTKLRSATVYGGVGMAPQIRALRGGAEIIVACPGRLLDHLESGNATLSHLEALVLDEADHMFDMGFLPAIRAIMKRVPAKAQRLLFSATMPGDLRQLAEGILKDPVTVEIGRSAPVETVTHALYPVGRDQKTEMLKHLLRKHDSRSALVFTRTKHGAKRLAEQLDKDNFFVTSLQGNLSQNKRQKALDGFREGRYHILVATDIAARGIDVTRISHVINYDVPTTAEAYTHRIGRTGRALRSGQAFTFITHEDEKIVHAIERSLGARIERVKVEDFAYKNDVYNSNAYNSDTGRDGTQTRRDRPPQGGRNSGQNGGRGRSRGGAEQARGNEQRRSQRGGSATPNRRSERPKR